MPIYNQAAPTVIVHQETGPEEVVLAFAYRPTTGADRRLRVFTEQAPDKLWWWPYVALQGEDDSLRKPSTIRTANLGVATRFGRWLYPKYSRGEFGPSTYHEFGVRKFETVSQAELDVIAQTTLNNAHPRGYAKWEGRLPMV